MMTTQQDLWGELSESVERTPTSILREQASALAAKTNNLLSADVSVTTSWPRDFSITFSIVAPSLDDYTYELFSVTHGVELYPVRVTDTAELLEDEKAFVDWLHKRLSSPKTMQVIRNLLSQARSV